MSLLPARMSRLLVGGHQAHMAGVIDVLHAQGAVHIEDYADPTHTTRIGEPLHAGEKASQLLVRVRGVQKALGIEPGTVTASNEAVPDAAALLRQAEAATTPSVERAAQIRARLAAIEAETQALQPIAGLDLDLGIARSLKSVAAWIGTARTSPRVALERTGVSHEAQVVPAGSGTGYAVAVVAATKDAAAIEKALAENGFAASTASGAGTPAKVLANLASERSELERESAAAATEVATLRTAWAPRLAAAERALAGEVERTQAPLRFGVTAQTFHLEGWVPTARADAVKSALSARFGDKLYVEDLGDAAMAEHAHDHDGDGHDGHAHHHAAPSGTAPSSPGAHEASEHHGSDPKSEPPVALTNKGLARPFEYLLGLLGRPRYQELDPSKLMLVFFPLFFGLMVGDAGIGLLIMLVGLFLVKNKVFGIGGPAIGKSILLGGLLSVLVGLFIFGEAFGIHFVVSAEQAHEGDLSWENIFGAHLPYETDAQHGLLYKTGSAEPHEALVEPVANASTEPSLLSEANLTHEASGGLLDVTPHSSTHLAVGGMVLGWYSKTHDTLALLIWASAIGLAHIILGLVLGVRNVYKLHGLKLAIQEKASWLILMLGAVFCIAAWGTALGYLGLGLIVASIVLLYMGAAHSIGVGFIALLEVPGLVGNILSYTRLAAIGASKAGMAVAFGSIAFVVIGGGTPEHPNTHSVLGWVVYAIAMGLILVLSIIAGTLQSLRLQFVESFSKFFTGGGRPYIPFGRRAP